MARGTAAQAGVAIPSPAISIFQRADPRGHRDGTLRSDLDPDLTMQAVINAVIGAQRRLASLGSKVELEFGQPIDRLFRETVRVLLLGMRAEAKTSTRRRPRKQKAGNGRTRKRSS